MCYGGVHAVCVLCVCVEGVCMRMVCVCRGVLCVWGGDMHAVFVGEGVCRPCGVCVWCVQAVGVWCVCVWSVEGVCMSCLCVV